MKDVLKMVRFDFVTAGSLTVPYVLAFIGLSFLLALFGMPLGLFCFAAPLVIFGPAREAAGAEQRKIYGILPIQRSAVTRAAFLEDTSMLIAGELLTMLLLIISDKSRLSRVLPESVAELLKYLKEAYNFSPVGLCVTIALLSAYLCVLSAYLEMEAEIHGHESDTKNILIALSVTAAVIALVFVLVNKGVLPPVSTWIELETAEGKGIFAVILNIAAAAVSAVMCEITVKKTAEKEI